MKEEFRFKRDHEMIWVPFLEQKSELIDFFLSFFFFFKEKVSLGIPG